MFSGFSDATLDFLWGIRFNNDKAWFEAHKGEYLEHLYRPMKELGAQLYEGMHAAWPKQDFLLKVSRIYRDARRLHGRGPYKDHLWLSLQGPAERWTDTPVFWFELTPDSWSYGLGFYCAQAVTMAKLRARMDARPKPMLDLVKRLGGQREFVLSGPSYARPKRAPHPNLTEWYNKKNFSLIHEEENSRVIYSPDLAGRVLEGWNFLMPFYEYLSTVPGDPDPRTAD